ncbi:MAG: hypothetical protein AB1486_18005 [Planctomycetota bacterium]
MGSSLTTPLHVVRARTVLEQALRLEPDNLRAHLLAVTLDRIEQEGARARGTMMPLADRPLERRWLGHELRGHWAVVLDSDDSPRKAQALTQEASWCVLGAAPETTAARLPARPLRRALTLLEQAHDCDPQRVDTLFNDWHLSGIAGLRARRRRAEHLIQTLMSREEPRPALLWRRRRAAAACLRCRALTTIEEWG